jgi:hypothetical protein
VTVKLSFTDLFDVNEFHQLVPATLPDSVPTLEDDRKVFKRLTRNEGEISMASRLARLQGTGDFSGFLCILWRCIRVSRVESEKVADLDVLPKERQSICNI